MDKNSSSDKSALALQEKKAPKWTGGKRIQRVGGGDKMPGTERKKQKAERQNCWWQKKRSKNRNHSSILLMLRSTAMMIYFPTLTLRHIQEGLFP